MNSFKKIILTATHFLIITAALAQAPQSFNYQAAVRDAGGNPISSQLIQVRIGLYDGTILEYEENHTITTSSSGLLNIAVGTGNITSGTFSALEWASTNYDIKVEINTGGGYVDLGTHPIQSVPYALNTIDPGWGLTGNAGTDTSHFIGTTDNKPLRFKVNNKNAGFITDGSPYSTAFGIGALKNLDTNIGLFNTAFGSFALYSNTTGRYNTASGDNALSFNTTGSNNTANGSRALQSNTTGDNNTANGSSALQSNTTGNNNTANGNKALYSNTTGYSNTANGDSTLFMNTTGYSNTANGASALYSNTTGSRNTANGASTLYSNTTGIGNTANGASALYSNTTGIGNTANGASALYSNTTGSSNTANGTSALAYNTTGSSNTANGNDALRSNTTGYNNTANGNMALYSNTTGYSNTANGNDALRYNTTGNYNTANGFDALSSNTTGNYNTATGVGAATNNTSGAMNSGFGRHALQYNTTGHYNSALGYKSGPGSANTSLINSTAIGNNARVDASNQIVLGNTSITEIGGYDSWSNLSDERFKTHMQPVAHGLDFIMKLEPIVYYMDIQKLNDFIYSGEENEFLNSEFSQTSIAEKESILYSGFSAQQVEKAANAIGYDFSGVNAPKNADKGHYSLSYAEFVVPLVKGMQEQQEIIESQQKTIDELKTEMQKLRSLIEKRQ